MQHSYLQGLLRASCSSIHSLQSQLLLLLLLLLLSFTHNGFCIIYSFLRQSCKLLLLLLLLLLLFLHILLLRFLHVLPHILLQLLYD
jgi:hypothetical protein